MARRKKGRPVHGWINLDKPLDMTSTQAVSAVRRIFDAKKAGHAGTLDPLASGVLPIALGEATKTVPFAQEAGKVYRFTVRWGEETTTFDAEGEVVRDSPVRPDEEALRAALPAFTGTIEQIPPAYSAIKVDGERAYDLARAGETVELQAREIEISHLHLLGMPEADLAVLEMGCGKGAYVRALARDLAAELGTVAHVAALRRVKVGPFDAANSITLDGLRALAEEGRADEALLPLETALAELPSVAVTEDEVFELRQGRAIVLLPNAAQSLKAARQPREIAGKDYSRAALAMGHDRAIAIGEAKAGRFAPVRVFQWG
ncbi:tRNA pseudouridine synthase B [Marinicauda pacifica]|uniref:tRNA pseudouridine synthase B n=1 Tax=Marinicauda pacifica TaxID=1133559 RepID=A0A4S2H9J0_9PROT|nr:MULTISPECIES: tRNA pseudouridine(55) synthase TruB [Marinicauda]TGY92530.1 tRNA pseudouridine(55) synthase TruB [Marinicauda pacifica]GGE49684.1 tRNA pseudouridine synthase B [Marinicauda pacifica]